MDPLNLHTFFSERECYIFHPERAQAEEKVSTYAATIILGLCTFGLVHVVYGIGLGLYKCIKCAKDRPSTIQKTQEVKGNIMPFIETESNTKSPETQTNQSVMIQTSQPVTTVVKLAALEKKLKDGIQAIDKYGIKDNKAKKEFLLEQGVNLFNGIKATPMQTQRLRKKYELSDYLKQPFKPLSIPLPKMTASFYDYVPTDKQNEDVVMDFAAKEAGGGVLSSGLGQEEIMFLEMPQLANYVAEKGHIEIRTPTGKQGAELVGKGKPNPLLFKNIMRVQEIKGYGDQIKKPTLAEFKNRVQILKTPQKVNIIALSAPDLSKETDQRVNISKEVASDLMYQLLEATRLVSEEGNPQKTPVIHGGLLGGGIFKGDPAMIVLVQFLVSQHMNVDFQLHGINETLQKTAQNYWSDCVSEMQDQTLDQCLDILVKARQNS